MKLVERCKRLETSPAFARLVLAAILFAGLLVGLETSADLRASHGGLLHALDRFVLALFALEAFVRIVARFPRPADYFRDPWNVFDFSVLVVCALPFDGQFLAVLRLARVLRVFRVVTSLPKLRILVGALFKSVPSMGYIGVLLALLFYVYAVIGTFKFGADSPEHFGNLGRSFLTLFQVVTLEGWVDIMQEQRGRWPLLAPAYFVSFILLGTMIALNLLIGVIVNGMSEAQEETALGQIASSFPGASTHEELEHLERQLDALARRMASLREKLPKQRP